jgi:phage-related protein (TIGR01555 family)
MATQAQVDNIVTMPDYPRVRIRAGASALQSDSETVRSIMDSYSNLQARLGYGSGNQASAGSYPLTRITNNYMLMLSVYRSQPIVRRIIDCMAEDMLKDFPTISSEITPEKIDQFEKAIKKTSTLEGLRTALKWGRLFGGAVGLICIKGAKNLSEPLVLDEIEPGSYMGIYALDRWSGVTPGSELISDVSNPKEFGLPTMYVCTMNSAVVNVHHSRLLRFTGRELPLWERQSEMYWGLSEVELVWDSLQKFNYASWNIVSLITRAQIFSITEPELASMMSGLGMSNQSYSRYVARMKALSDSMNAQGLMVLGKDGTLNQHTFSFGGLADIMEKQMMNLASDAGYPFEVLYGRQSGLGSNGESGLQVYYDSIEQKRTRELNPQMDKLIPIICMSTYGEVPDDIDYIWSPVRTMSNKERSELADKTSAAIVNLYNADLITKKEARMDLKQASGDNGLCSPITDESIEATPDKYASEQGGGELDLREDFGEGASGSGSESESGASESEGREKEVERRDS